MSVEAMWQVTFAKGTTEANFDGGSAVFVLETGRVFGGDSWFYFTGIYAVKNGKMSVQVRSRRHADGAQSVARSDDEILVLEGAVGETEMTLAGHVASNPDRVFVAELRRLDNLP